MKSFFFLLTVVVLQRQRAVRVGRVDRDAVRAREHPREGRVGTTALENVVVGTAAQTPRERARHDVTRRAALVRRGLYNVGQVRRRAVVVVEGRDDRLFLPRRREQDGGSVVRERPLRQSGERRDRVKRQREELSCRQVPESVSTRCRERGADESALPTAKKSVVNSERTATLILNVMRWATVARERSRDRGGAERKGGKHAREKQ